VPTRRPHLHAARTGAGDPGDAVRRGDAVGRADDRAGRGDEVVGRADGWVETARGPPRSSTLSSESPPAEDDDGDGGDTSPVNAGGPRDGTVGIPGTSPMPPGRTSANSRGKSAAGTTASTHAPSASRAKTRTTASRRAVAGRCKVQAVRFVGTDARLTVSEFVRANGRLARGLLFYGWTSGRVQSDGNAIAVPAFR
jgi:hypothetical protein